MRIRKTTASPEVELVNRDYPQRAFAVSPRKWDSMTVEGIPLSTGETLYPTKVKLGYSTKYIRHEVDAFVQRLIEDAQR